jgi:hypothetical protein
MADYGASSCPTDPNVVLATMFSQLPLSLGQTSDKQCGDLCSSLYEILPIFRCVAPDEFEKASRDCARSPHYLWLSDLCRHCPIVLAAWVAAAEAETDGGLLFFSLAVRMQVIGISGNLSEMTAAWFGGVAGYAAREG